MVVVPIYALAAWLSYRAVAERLEAHAIESADQLAERLADDLDAVIRPIQGAIQTVAFQLEETDPPRSLYVEHIRGVLGAWQDVYGSTIAVEVKGRGDKPFAPYLYRHDGRIDEADLAQANYGYRTLPWYRLAADSRQAVWSPPYFDRGGGEIWMVTYSVPFFRRSGETRTLAGVVTADLGLDWMQRTAAHVALGATGMGWVSSGSGDGEFAIAIGDTTQRLKRLAAPLDATAARAAGAAMLARGQSFGLMPKQISRSPVYVAVRSLGTLGWNLTLLTPRDELLGEARAQLRRQIMLGVIGLIALVIAISLVAAGVARPIHALAEAVEQVDESGAAELHFSLPEAARQDEVGVLTRALARLRDSLQQHVRLRAASLAAQVRLEHELEVSRQIQQSMLPQGDAIRSLPPGIEIAATLIPAQQVGGDLYDYFRIQDGQLLFAVGDVSDKGIPAALFMARMSALMRVLGAGGASPERLLGEVNRRLAEGNEACMFVTVGCGLLDPVTGALRYASAGHDAPLVRLAEGEVRETCGANGAAIGIDAGTDYPLQRSQLAPGDVLLLYTDGLSEAEDEGGRHLGIDRVAALLRDVRDTQPAVLVAHIVAAVASHAAGFHATDDLTVLALRFSPADVTTRTETDGVGWLLTIEPSRAGLQRAQQRLRGILAARDIGGELGHDIELVAEEWLTNVLRAAGTTPLSQLSLDIVLTRAAIQLTFLDDGAPFDPLAAAAPALDTDIGERPIGGLGLHLVQQMAQRCDYARVDGCNALLLRFVRNQGDSTCH